MISRVTTSQRFYALIRAINTGGRRITNDELIEPFVKLGFTDVAAYQAAGNITFRSGDAGTVVAESLEAALAAAYGFDAPVFVRSRPQLVAVNDASPFTKEEIAQTDGRIQVAFMRAAPDESTVAEARALVPPDDRVAFAGREWFWLPARGISDSQLPVGAFERLVGPMTIRTLGTVSRMLGRFG